MSYPFDLKNALIAVFGMGWLCCASSLLAVDAADHIGETRTPGKRPDVVMGQFVATGRNAEAQRELAKARVETIKRYQEDFKNEANAIFPDGVLRWLVSVPMETQGTKRETVSFEEQTARELGRHKSLALDISALATALPDKEEVTYEKLKTRMRELGQVPKHRLKRPEILSSIVTHLHGQSGDPKVLALRLATEAAKAAQLLEHWQGKWAQLALDNRPAQNARPVADARSDEAKDKPKADTQDDQDKDESDGNDAEDEQAPPQTPGSEYNDPFSGGGMLSLGSLAGLARLRSANDEGPSFLSRALSGFGPEENGERRGDIQLELTPNSTINPLVPPDKSVAYREEYRSSNALLELARGNVAGKGKLGLISKPLWKDGLDPRLADKVKPNDGDNPVQSGGAQNEKSEGGGDIPSFSSDSNGLTRAIASIDGGFGPSGEAGKSENVLTGGTRPVASSANGAIQATLGASQNFLRKPVLSGDVPHSAILFAFNWRHQLSRRMKRLPVIFSSGT